MCLYPRIIMSKSHENTSKCVDTVTFLWKKLEPKGIDPKMTFDPHVLRSHVWLYPRIIMSKSHENTSKYVDTVTFFAKNLNQRSLTPKWPLTLSLLRSHVWHYPRIIVTKSHENTSKYVDTVTFFKNLNQRSLTPRWPLTSCLLRSHVWLYSRIIVSKSHGNTAMHVDTVINFAKYPNIFTYILHTAGTYYVQNERSHSLFLNTFRRDKNDITITFLGLFSPPPPYFFTLVCKTLSDRDPVIWNFACRVY